MSKQATPAKDKQARPGRIKLVATGYSADVTTKQPPSAPKGVRLGVWSGKPLYECEQCPYNDLDLRRLLEHVAARHAPAIVDTGLVGPTGRAVIKEVTDGKD